MTIKVGDLVTTQRALDREGVDALPFRVRSIERDGRITLSMWKSGEPICLGAMPWEPNEVSSFDQEGFVVIEVGSLPKGEEAELCRKIELVRTDDTIIGNCGCGTYLGYVAADSSVDRLTDMWDVHMHTGTPGEKLKSF